LLSRLTRAKIGASMASKRGILWVSGAIAAGFALLLLSSPLWFPWVLRPVLAQYHVHFSRYERDGFNHFRLQDVFYSNHTIEFRARTVDGLLPSTWLWEKYIARNEKPFLRFAGWQLREGPVGESGSSPGMARSTPGSKPLTSTFALVREAHREDAFLIRWTPRVDLVNGLIEFHSEKVIIALLHWDRGRLSGEGILPRFKQTATFDALLPPRAPWHLSTQVEPLKAEFELRMADHPTGLRIEGRTTWQTNQLDFTAEFATNGWLPHLARAGSHAFRIPASAFGLNGYQDLAGSFDAEWTEPRYHVDLTAQASPFPKNAARLLPVNVTLQAEGGTNHIELEQVQLISPPLELRLTKGVTLTYAGKLLSPEAGLEFRANLRNQPWFPLTGNIRGKALLHPGSGKYPEAAVTMEATHVGMASFRTEDVQLQAQLNWPWLEIDRARATLAPAGTASLLAKINLESRFVTNGVLHVSGQLATNLLPAGMAYDQLALQANVTGPIASLRHDGFLEVDGIKLPSMRSVRMRAEWQGQAAHLDHVRARLSQGTAELRIAGSGSYTPPAVEVHLDTVDLMTNQQPVYQLAQPFDLTFQPHRSVGPSAPRWSAQLSPALWRGPGRALALAATMNWPESGNLVLSSTNFETHLLAPFLKESLPAIQLDHAHLAAHWNKGPLQFDLDARAQYRAPGQNPVLGGVQARTTEHGIELPQIEVGSPSMPVISGHGYLPLRVEPEEPTLVRLDQNKPVDLHLVTTPNPQFWSDVSSLIRMRLTQPRLQLDVTGPLTSPTGTIRAAIESLQAEARGTNSMLPPLNHLRATLALNQTAVRLEQLRFQVEGQPVWMAGAVPMGRDFSVSWKRFFPWNQATGLVEIAQAKIAPFARFLPEEISPEGEFSVQLALRPNLQFSGGLSLHGAATRPLPDVGTIQDLETKWTVSGRKIHVATLTGLIGGEPFGINGDIDLAKRDANTGLPDVHLTLRGEDIPLARQPDLILRSDLNLTLSSRTNSQPVLSGSARLRDSVVLSDLRVLMPGRAALPKERPPYFSIETEPLAQWRLDVHVHGDKFLKIRTPFFNGEASTDLRLEGDLKEPQLLGDVTINSGLVQFPFATLDVSQGLVSFSSANPYQPQLYVSAASKAFGYDVRMEVTGTAEAPALQFSSTPPLSSEQVLLMLTSGEVPQAENPVTTQQRASRLAMFLGKNLLSEFSGTGGAADRLSVRSGEYMSEQGQPTYSLEYRLSKHWSIVGEYDRFGDFNAGLKWRIYSH
jgi:translocation and assembly module TamB